VLRAQHILHGLPPIRPRNCAIAYAMACAHSTRPGARESRKRMGLLHLDLLLNWAPTQRFISAAQLLALSLA
jgi:hypothetical protein